MRTQHTVPVGRSPRLDGPAWVDVGWQDSAGCAGTPDELWFPSANHPNRRKERTAKNICSRCPVQAECLAWAFEIGDHWAILGGTTPTERYRMQRKVRRAAQ